MAVTELGSLVALQPLRAREAILGALGATGGRVTVTASLLGVPVRSLWRYLHQLGIDPRESKAGTPLGRLRKEVKRIAGSAVHVTTQEDGTIKVSYAGHHWVGTVDTALTVLTQIPSDSKGKAVIDSLTGGLANGR